MLSTWCSRREKKTHPVKNTQDVLKSTETSEALAREVITISSGGSLEPNILTIESDSNEPTMLYAYGRQQLFIRPKFKDLNLQMNPLDVMTLVSPAPNTDEQTYPTQEVDNPINLGIFDISDNFNAANGDLYGR